MEMPEVKCNTTEMKNVIDALISGLETLIKKKISETEDVLIEISKTEKQRKKYWKTKTKTKDHRYIIFKLQKNKDKGKILIEIRGKNTLPVEEQG